MSILAAYARIPCEVQSICLHEYTLYKQHSKKVGSVTDGDKDSKDAYEIALIRDKRYRQYCHLWKKVAGSVFILSLCL